MTDVVIEAIKSGSINANNVSFDTLRRTAGRDTGRWSELGRGRAILDSYEQLDQYLYSYGPMTKSQWSSFLPHVSLPNGKLMLTDYGCGQGLGSALLLDHFGAPLTGRLEHVRLIEPSNLALERAAYVAACYLGDLDSPPISLINKKLDDLSPNDMQTKSTSSQVHLLSNVLDIDGFNHGMLFSRIFQVPGQHTVLAASHDRDFYGGSARFEQLETEIKNPKHSQWLTVQASNVGKFNCGNGQPAICWELHVEVLSGSI
jgi:hypothetical protein